MRAIPAVVVVLGITLLLVGTPGQRTGAWGGQVLEGMGPGPGYVEVPHDPALNPLGAITIEAWVYLRSHAGHGGGYEPSIVGKNWTSGYWLGVDYYDGSLRFYTHGGASSIDGNAPLPLNDWVHVAVTYEGTTQRHYINGVLDLESGASPGALTTNSDPLRIGGDAGWDYSPDGFVDEVRIWAVERSGAEIAATMNTTITTPQAGLIAAWNFEGDANDSVGGHHGTLVGDARIVAGLPTAVPTATPSPTPTDAPTPTPTPGGAPKGDMDCDGDADTVDALHILRHVAGLPGTLPPGCDAVGE